MEYKMHAILQMIKDSSFKLRLFTPINLSIMQKHLIMLNEGQAMKYLVLVDLYSKSQRWIDKLTMIKEMKKDKKYRTTLIKYFTASEGKNTRGNEVFGKLLEKSYQHTKTQRRGKRTLSQFRRRMALYRPIGVLRSYCELYCLWTQAVDSCEEYLILRQKSLVSQEKDTGSNFRISEIKNGLSDYHPNLLKEHLWRTVAIQTTETEVDQMVNTYLSSMQTLKITKSLNGELLTLKEEASKSYRKIIEIVNLQLDKLKKVKASQKAISPAKIALIAYRDGNTKPKKFAAIVKLAKSLNNILLSDMASYADDLRNEQASLRESIHEAIEMFIINPSDSDIDQQLAKLKVIQQDIITKSQDVGKLPNLE
jgi:hypothetical protein